MHAMQPLVAIIGRPNVGKSTLFNRLVGSRRAITSELAGTTRDRLYAEGEWRGIPMTFIDTGGLSEQDSASATGTRRTAGQDTLAKPLQAAINDQVAEAVREADVLLWILSAPDGLTAEDRRVAEVIRGTSKPVLVVANKADNQNLETAAAEFWELGIGEPLPVSSLHGRGTGDLLDRLVGQLGPAQPAQAKQERNHPAVAIVGRSNVGKSTLVNRLSGAARMITSEHPHTTRDSTELEVATEAGPLTLLDTAGMRRRGQSGQGIPKYSLLRTLRAINEADVACLLIDADEGPTLQDAHICSYIIEAGKAIVLVVNKWDLIEKSSDVQEQWFARLEQRFGFLPSPPVVFVSALTGEKLERFGRAVYDVWELAATRLETGELNRVLRANLVKLPGGRGGPKLYYATQVDVRPPTILCFVNKSEAWAANHRRFLENTIRDHYGLYGTALRLRFRAKQPREVVA